MRGEIIKIDPREIKVSPYNIRKRNVKGRDWKELKASIKATDGPIEAPIISKNKEVIVGHRRVLASQELGLPKINAYILKEDISEEEAVKLSFIENRGGNITSEDEEEAIKRLLAIFKTNDKVAEFLGINPSLITMILSRATMPKRVTRKHRQTTKPEQK